MTVEEKLPFFRRAGWRKYPEDIFDPAPHGDVSWALIDECKEVIEEKFRPAGYNIGFNVVRAGGPSHEKTKVFELGEGHQTRNTRKIRQDSSSWRMYQT